MNALLALALFVAGGWSHAGRPAGGAVGGGARDITAPVVTLSAYPNFRTNSTTAAFTFATTESATFECQIDGGGYSSCTSVKTYTSRTDGSHTFNVRATDTAGNLGNATSWAWVIEADYTNIKSVHFEGGNDFCSFGQPSDLEWDPNGQEVTISAWTRSDDAARQHIFLSKAAMSTNSVSYLMAGYTDGTIYAIVGDGNNGSGNVQDLGWHHTLLTVRNVAGVYTYFLFEDGVQVGTGAAGADQNTTVDWMIGAARWDDNVGTSYEYTGYVDEVTFWNAAFTDANVTALYNGGVTSNPVTHAKSDYLLHHYRVDGDTYPTLTDRIGTSNGTCTNLASSANYTSTVPVGLTPMPCAGTCNLHFVADDWSGSGNWTSRDSNAWVGVFGASMTKQSSSQFTGRYEIDQTAATGSRFIVANNSSSVVAGSQTLELIIRGTASADAWIIETSDNYAASAGATMVLLDAVTGFVYARVMNAAATTLWTTNNSTNLHSKNAIVHLVTDTGASKGRLYVNGVQAGGDISFTGSVSGAQSYRFLMGASQGNKGAYFLEATRYASALTTAQVAARSWQFNALKGY